jgi:hypothetical protein
MDPLGEDLVHSQIEASRVGGAADLPLCVCLICAREVGRNLAESSLSILPTGQSESTKKSD